MTFRGAIRWWENFTGALQFGGVMQYPIFCSETILRELMWLDNIGLLRSHVIGNDLKREGLKSWWVSRIIQVRSSKKKTFF